MTRPLLIALLILCVFAASASGKTALVVYDETTEDLTVAVTNLIGHFREYLAEPVTLDQIEKEPEKVASADAVFYLASYDSPPAGPLFAGVLKSRTLTTCYIGTHRSLGALPSIQTVDSVEYRGRRFWLDAFPVHQMSRPFGETVVSFFRADSSVPFIEKKEAEWLVSGKPVFEIPAWVFADVLHDILQTPHSPIRKAMIRLEDINPSYRGKRLDKLRDCIRYLKEEGVPFSMAVFPVFINPKGKKLATVLPDNQELVAVLQEAERSGGTVIMHGTSHQYHQVSGEGSEFWDVETDGPIPDETKYFDSHMKYGLWLFQRAGLHPLLFEAPHYNMPLSLQKELGRYFGAIAGSLMINNKTYLTTQDFPYLIYRSYSGLKVIPEQLGYIATNAETVSVRTIIERLDLLAAIVRDPFACFFYHPYVAGDMYLRELIPLVRDMGFVFVDVGSEMGEPPRVEIEPVEDLWDVAKRETSETNYIPLAAGSVSAFVLFMIYLRLRKKRKKELFRQ